MDDAGPTQHDGALTGSAPIHPLGVRVGYAVGITSGRRAATLAAVVCVLVLSVAVPLRTYLGQRAELAAVYEQQHILADKIGELERRRVLLADPEHTETQARERLRYVRPGEIPYLVQLPPGGTSAAAVSSVRTPMQPWYDQLWESINSG
ncbi:MAG: FtsB family cell division protein [Pseudonocardiaceae bacterium]